MTRAILTGSGRFFFGSRSEELHRRAERRPPNQAALLLLLACRLLPGLLLAALLVDLAQLPFQFRDQLLDARSGHIVARLPRQRAVLHDLHFEFHPLVLVGHEARVLI
jgi:hypothetical protein